MAEIKKMEKIDESSFPAFEVSRRGGYLEESVDQWLTNHFAQLNQMIEYQNYCVDVIKDHEAKNDELNEKLAAEQSRAVVAEQRVAELEAQLEEARGTVENAATVAPVQPVVTDEAIAASTLLQNATRVANETIEQAQADAANIRSDAEATVVDIRAEIERLEGVRFATFQTLSNFFIEEHKRLSELDIFSPVVNEEEAPAEEETASEPEDVADFPAQEAVSLEEAEEAGYELDYKPDDDDAVISGENEGLPPVQYTDGDELEENEN